MGLEPRLPPIERPPDAGNPLANAPWGLLTDIRRSVRIHRAAILASCLAVLITVGGAAHSYNSLVQLRLQVEDDSANLEALLQARTHVRRNVTGVMAAYAQHEQSLLGRITDLRTSAGGAQRDAPGVQRPRRTMVAEQRPSLKLTRNFQQFSGAIVKTEHRIATHLITYNRDVTAYVTERNQFPGKLLARLFGFEPKPFFSADLQVVGFKPVAY